MRPNHRMWGLDTKRDRGLISPLRDDERILGQIERREISAGPDAARKIAQKITDQGGFWGPRKEQEE